MVRLSHAMKILDCESTESAYDSLEQIFAVGRDKLESIFEEIDIDAIYKTSPTLLGAGHEVLFSVVTKRLSKRVFAYDQTCWFHLTRTTGPNRFEAGILPTGEAMGFLWEFLYGLLEGAISEADWEKFKIDILASSDWYAKAYQLRVTDPSLSGPYAMLVKDIAFNAQALGNHDYFLVPEIVQNICTWFRKNHEIDLLDAFCKKTMPCIVKFIDDGTKPKYLWAALYYLYSLHRGDKLTWCCNTTFGGMGRLVPKERILKVEFPEYRPP